MTEHPATVPVGSRRERYLVAPLGVPPEPFFAHLAEEPAATVHRIVSSVPAFAVVEMDADRAAMLTVSGTAHVEPDWPLAYSAPATEPALFLPGEVARLAFLVTGSDGSPLSGAEVYLMNEALPLRGVTGTDGRVVIDVPCGMLPLDGVHVKPRHGYWAIWLGSPELSVESQNLMVCPSFEETFPGFPQRPLDGWARRAMRFDALPPTFRGDGVRVAIVDSGASMDHPDLAGRIAGDRDCWQDRIGHGTHAAGVIGGADDGHGIVGVVPEALLHSCRVFPGGRFSDLIEAIDHCVAEQIDVINLSLGSAHFSPLVTGRIEQARQCGIAVVAAAGSSAGPVLFPAALPGVLAVAAIGRLGEFPPESHHATRVYGSPTADGYFSASFTCHGPEVDVCAPGVAIVSSVPPSNYAAWDGTSFAAPYVTGLAALLLAHHPDFRGRYTTRDAARVDRLFELIKGSCRPLALGDRNRTGAGLPDAVAAFGLRQSAHPWGNGRSPANQHPEQHPRTTLTAPAGEPLDPLRAAMRSAGLLPGKR